MTHSATKFLTLATILILLQGCAAMGPAPSEQILGTWQTTVGAFPMTVTYAADTVQTGSNAPVTYALDGNRLTYAEGGQQVRLVSFPESGLMIQNDPVTGTNHRFARVSGL